MPAPLIETQRLKLRPMMMSDMALYLAFFQTERAQKYMSIPKDRSMHWYGFASELGSWDLQGFGGWTIEQSGVAIGQVALSHPPHWPELELGWFLFEGYEGKGFAYEASLAARDYAAQTLKARQLVSYIHPNNRRSIALAERLGAVHDPRAAKFDKNDLVYRHFPRGFV